MNDLLQHVLTTGASLFDELIIVGLTKPNENGDSEFVYFVQGEAFVCKGLAEVAVEKLGEEVDEED